jgi:HEAT repeat protein
MNALALLCVLAPAAPVPKQPPPPSEARIKFLLEKLEEPTRDYRDPKQGPPDGPPPDFFFRHSPALGELRQAGTHVQTALLEFLANTAKPGQARAQAADALVDLFKGTGAEQPLNETLAKAIQSALRDKSRAVRWTTLKAVARYGEVDAKERHAMVVKHVPNLVRERMYFSEAATNALLPDILALLRDPSPEIALAAAEALYNFGRPKAGVKELLAALEREEADVRGMVCLVLGRVAPDDADVAKAVVGQLKSGHARGNYWIGTSSVGAFGPKAKDAVPELIECIKRTEWKPSTIGKTKEEREKQSLLNLGAECAIVSLGKIGPDAKAAGPFVVKYLQSCQPGGARESILKALDQMDPESAKQAREYLAKLAVEFRQQNERK